jgi:hypothetical protein
MPSEVDAESISNFRPYFSDQAVLTAGELKKILNRIEALEKCLEKMAENLDIQFDLINQLRKPEATIGEKIRADKIERYLRERPDHRATYETLRGFLGVDKARLNEAIKILVASEPGRYGIMRLPGDKRKRVLIMLPK